MNLFRLWINCQSRIATYVCSEAQQTQLFIINIFHINTRIILFICTLHFSTHICLSCAEKKSLLSLAQKGLSLSLSRGKEGRSFLEFTSYRLKLWPTLTSIISLSLQLYGRWSWLSLEDRIFWHRNQGDPTSSLININCPSLGLMLLI